MGAAYSVDLRRKVVQACERSTASQAEVARFFLASVCRLSRSCCGCIAAPGRSNPTGSGQAAPRCSMRQRANKCNVGWLSETT